jgi:GTP-binding protein
MTSTKELFSAKPKFIAGASSIEQIPYNLFMPEVAFVGRSNVGKSSLINAIVGDKNCARVSKNPGRTQQINFFTISDKISVADLPGYGYAAVSKKVRKSWDKLILDYLRGRQNLRRIFLLIDSRHSFKATDEEIMNILDDSAVVYQIILTKIDKISNILNIKQEIEAKISMHTAAFPEILATSSEKMIGISDVQKAIATFS